LWGVDLDDDDDDKNDGDGSRIRLVVFEEDGLIWETIL
jgi:hypothetical protein